MDHFRTERRLAAILAADVVGYTLLMAADEKPHPPEGAADRLIRPWIV